MGKPCISPDIYRDTGAFMPPPNDHCLPNGRIVIIS